MMGSEAEQRAYYEQCRDGAQRGDVDAMAAVGQCYDFGMGVEKSAEASMSWFHRAAVEGHAEAQFRLASFYFCGNASGSAQAFEVTPDMRGPDNTIHDWAKANWWSKPAALEGTGTILDAAMKWYRAAATQGHVEAMHELGCRLFEFGDVERQAVERQAVEREAFSWFEKAAATDHPGATYRLGICYQTGHGVRANAAKATELFQKATALGEPLAAGFLTGGPSKVSARARHRARKAETKGLLNLDDPAGVPRPETTTPGSTRAQNAEIALGQLRCANCGRHERVDREAPFKKCAKCKRVLYCSKECQTHHWRHGGHKSNCRRTPPSA